MGQCTDSLSSSPYLLATLLSRTHFSKEVVKSMSVQCKELCFFGNICCSMSVLYFAPKFFFSQLLWKLFLSVFQVTHM